MKYLIDDETQELLEMYNQCDAEEQEITLELLRAMKASQKTSEYDETALIEYLQMRVAFTGDMITKKALESLIRIKASDTPYRSYCERLERRKQGKCIECGGDISIFRKCKNCGSRRGSQSI